MPRRQLLISTIIFGLILSCGPRVQHDYFKSYHLYKPGKTDVGSPMIVLRDVYYVDAPEQKNVCLAPSAKQFRNSRYYTIDSFRQELIYSGRSGDTITVSYREYKQDMARPAFYQQLQYDLSISDTIVFQNFKIQVVDANNEFIRYKVLAD